MTILEALKKHQEAKEAIAISVAPLPLVTDVQTVLKKLDLYKGAIDGIAGGRTLAAFIEFKRLSHLEYPEMLGASTAGELLDAYGEPHPTPQQDQIDADPTAIQIVLPSGLRTHTAAPIISGGHFSWGELTKNGSRIPVDRQVEGNIVRLATYMEKVRAKLDNRAISINSGYRPPKINRQVGGASASRHLTGEAVDFVVEGIAPLKVYAILDSWHQGGLGKSSIFTHLDVRKGYSPRWVY